MPPYAWETGIARQFVGIGEVFDLLDYPGYFELLGKPIPEGRGAVLESLESDRLISRDVGGKRNVLNLAADPASPFHRAAVCASLAPAGGHAVCSHVGPRTSRDLSCILANETAGEVQTLECLR